MGQVYRIGFLVPASASGQVNRVEALRTGLLELGYLEGKNVVIEYRWVEGKSDRLPNSPTPWTRVGRLCAGALAPRSSESAMKSVNLSPSTSFEVTGFSLLPME